MWKLTVFVSRRYSTATAQRAGPEHVVALVRGLTFADLELRSRSGQAPPGLGPALRVALDLDGLEDDAAALPADGDLSGRETKGLGKPHRLAPPAPEHLGALGLGGAARRRLLLAGHLSSLW
jgi:hypothetical protein